MPAATRVRTPATEDWETLQLRFHWPEQADYELIRPVVLFGLPVADRAGQTGVSQRTIARHADRFDAAGFAGLREPEPAPRLSDDIRQTLRELKAEYAGFGLRELATIVDVRFGRRVGHHTVARVLADGPLPLPPARRFPPYHQLAAGTDRRLAVVRLHVEGWSVQSIAGYLETSRQTVYTVLQRWATEDFAGLPDKPHTRKRRSLKVDLATLDIARELQENPLLGEFRLHSKLKQTFGIDLSPRTCGRILAHNRAVYGLPGPEKRPHTPKKMPFAARYRHQYWTVDLRYIDHRLDANNVYCISIIENYSRAILASSLSRRQDLSAFLSVFYAAVREYGSPKALVSDGGSIFKADRAKAIYAALGIEHKPIARHQPWQSYIETHFGIQRRLGDYYFAKAQTWLELQHVHDRFVYDYTEQEHWAHRQRRDGQRSPKDVLNWVIGTPHEPTELAQLFAPVRYTRRLDRAGYAQFRRWRVYGQRALPKQPALVWLADIIAPANWGDGNKTPKITSTIIYKNHDPHDLPQALQTNLDWQPDLRVMGDPAGFFLSTGEPGGPATLNLHGVFVTDLRTGESSYSLLGDMRNFAVRLLGSGAPFIIVHFDKLAFAANAFAKPNFDVNISKVEFAGALLFINGLQQFLATVAAKTGLSIDARPTGITAGYTLPVPRIAIGAFSLQNINIAAGLTLPFSGDPARVRFSFCTREHPFLLTVMFIGGGGFVAVALGLDGVELLEVSLEFGATIALDIGVASGEVHLMAGIYIKLAKGNVQLTGYVRLGGSLDILGIISMTIEFYLGLTYDPGKGAWGQAKVTVEVKVLFFSKSVSLNVEKRFAGGAQAMGAAPFDGLLRPRLAPSFKEFMSLPEWEEYATAFATLPGR